MSEQFVRFGDPLLRQKAERIDVADIAGERVKTLVANMQGLLDSEQYGVGLAAPQIGESLAICVIGIKPTPNRPGLARFDEVMINPSITEYHGGLEPMWEACMSCGSGDDLLYAQAERHPEVVARWLDQTGTEHTQTFDDFAAHVIQHEADHLNGVLFVDRVKDPTTFMMADEYRQRVVKQK